MLGERQIKVLVLFGRPIDEEAFEEHLRSRHAPLLDSLPNVTKTEIFHIIGAAKGESVSERIISIGANLTTSS